MMTLRAYFFDPKVPRPERPEQAFFQHTAQAEDWAKKKLEKASDEAEVWLYEVTETLIGSYKKKI